jgi:hypothetical protein
VKADERMMLVVLVIFAVVTVVVIFVIIVIVAVDVAACRVKVLHLKTGCPRRRLF